MSKLQKLKFCFILFPFKTVHRDIYCLQLFFENESSQHLMPATFFKIKVAIKISQLSQLFSSQQYQPIKYGLLLKEHLQRTQVKLEHDCLEHHCERSSMLCDWSSTQVSFFLLTREAAIVKV